MTMTIDHRPFKIAIADEVLADMRGRIARTRLPDLPRTTGWIDGCDLWQLGAFLGYWATEFDWRAFEARVNRYQQYLTLIDGAEIHFLHVPVAADVRAKARVVPALLLHGWPGSWVEFLQIIELLTTERNGIAFDLVIPSLPGFGFSRRATDGPMGLPRAADIFARLMGSLGYERFLVQGGDFGAGVGSALALRHPERVLGLHLNYIPGSYRPGLAPDAELAPDERAYLAFVADWSQREGAYSHLHRTRPHALSVGLTDSPAGLAAWILEKFAAWADCDRDLTRLPAELLAANLTLYWVTGSLATSIEYYRDVAQQPFHLRPGERVRPPCAIARFPREAPLPPCRWIERGYNIVRWTEQPRGGHFAALEQPALLADDVRSFTLSLL